MFLLTVRNSIFWDVFVGVVYGILYLAFVRDVYPVSNLSALLTYPSQLSYRLHGYQRLVIWHQRSGLLRNRCGHSRHHRVGTTAPQNDQRP